MSWMGSHGVGPGASSAPAGLRRNTMRWAAGGAAVTAAVAAALGGASAAVAAPAVTTPVPCSVTLLGPAISGAPANATLVLSPGCVYRLTAALPTITKNLTIDGSNDTITAFSGNYTILTNNGASVALRQLRITDANNNAPGAKAGAIFNTGIGARMSLSDVTLADNTGSSGGAVYNNAGDSLTVADSTFDGNEATSATGGGAIFNALGATTTVSGSTFRDNEAEAGVGGAISSVGGSVAVRSPASTFSRNTADGTVSTGGAISVAAGSLSVTGAQFADNNADNDGGGVAVAAGVTATVAESTFTGNVTGDNGGAISTGTSLRLAEDTLARNQAHDNGGGLYAAGGNTRLDGTLVFLNRAVTGTGGGIDRTGGTVSLSFDSVVSVNKPNNCSGVFCPA
jgi:predicted outer membrane repeat protein